MEQFEQSATTEISIGENEQSYAESADIEAKAGANESDFAEPTDETEEQSSDDNARYAAIRRKAEDDARKRFDAERAIIETNIITSLGIYDDQTGRPITTQAEYQAYAARQSAANKQALAQRLGIDEDELDEAISSLPEVKQARIAKANAERERADSRLSEELKKIQQIDPSIKSINDVLEHETYSKVRDLNRRGIPLSEAFEFANHKRLARLSNDAAKQATLNSVNSKAHLTPTVSGSIVTSNVSVPEAIKQMYKQLNPNMTDKQISQHYSKYKK